MSYAIVNSTLDNQVGVRNINADPGMILIEIEHEHRQRGPRQYAQVTPAQARILADALNLCADETEAEQDALSGRLTLDGKVDLR